MANIIRKYIDAFIYREKKHITDPSAEVYYVIRRKPLWEGFFSNYFYVLSNIIYADAHGWKSTVDMINYPTLYSEKYEINGTNNSWEYYFRQPNDVAVEKVYSKGNYVLSKNCYYGDLGVPVYKINQGHITDDMVRLLYPLQKERIPIRKEFIDEADEKFDKLIGKDMCIGVHVRGTDMNNGLKLHTLPPSLIEIFNNVDSILSENDCKIFLCTDENNTTLLFQERYGDRVKMLNAYRADGETTIGIHKQNSNRELHHYNLGKEVLLDALMLSKCDYLICGVSNVTSAAVLFNNLKYKKVVVIK